MSELVTIRAIDLKGSGIDTPEIEFLRAELPPPKAPFATIRYAIDGVEQPNGLRIDLDKQVFLDHFDDDEQKEHALKEATPQIVRFLASMIAETPLSEEEVNHWIRTHAKYSAAVRQARKLPQGDDERYAEQALADDILEGIINFARRIAPQSYKFLEEIWSNEVIQAKAHLLWEADQTYGDTWEQASEHLRGLLIMQRKATKEEFQSPKAYLEDKYLQPDGKIDWKKAQPLVDKKADRIQEMKPDETNREKNKQNARIYIEMFYEHIIPGVLTDDSEHVLNVLKSFQHGAAPAGHMIINAFEAALAIYFLNPEVIQKLWNQAKGTPLPESSIRTVVQVTTWPEQFEVPEECRHYFEFDYEGIIFNGVMSVQQKDALLRNLSDNLLKEKVCDLFRLTRLIHKDTTF